MFGYLKSSQSIREYVRNPIIKDKDTMFLVMEKMLSISLMELFAGCKYEGDKNSNNVSICSDIASLLLIDKRIATSKKFTFLDFLVHVQVHCDIPMHKKLSFDDCCIINKLGQCLVVNQHESQTGNRKIPFKMFALFDVHGYINLIKKFYEYPDRERIDQCCLDIPEFEKMDKLGELILDISARMMDFVKKHASDGGYTKYDVTSKELNCFVLCLRLMLNPFLGLHPQEYETKLDEVTHYELFK